MEKIPSFTIDHDRLLRGCYVSRKDYLGSEVVTTFDIRMKEPNREPVMDMAALHTIEHLGATYLRNNNNWKDKIVYFGPMGCRTGNYLLVHGDYEAKDIIPVLTKMFEFVANFEEEVPGTKARDCGNFLDHNLPMAIWEAKKFLKEILYNLREENLKYPED